MFSAKSIMIMTKDTKKKNEKMAVGGQAVIEGVMMRSMNRISLAVRKPDNEIEVQGWSFEPYSKRNKIMGIPIIRGFVNMVEMLYWGIKTLELSAQIASGEDTRKPSIASKIWGGLSLIIGLAIGIALFAFSPLWISGLLGFRENPFLFNLFAGAIRVVLFMSYLLAISQMKDIKRLFRYHGAEHKTIHAFEKGEPLIPERVQKYSTFHPRCGTSFILITALAAIFFFAFVDGFIYLIWSYAPKALVRLPIHLALLPLLAGVSYELLKLSAKLSQKSKIVAFLVSPGLWLQKITTKQPDESMLEVAIAALMDSIQDITIGDKN